MNVSVEELDAGSAGGAARGESLAPARARALAAWEIASVVSSALIAEWAVLALVGFSKLWLAVPVAFAVALMIASHRARGETLRQLGWRFDNLWDALRVLLPLMAAGALVLALWGWVWFGGRFRVGGWRAGWWGLGFPVWGVAWGLVQQYVLQAFINRRAQEIFGAGWQSVLLVALLFALLHLPNPSLTAATFLGGLVWAYAYQRAPNLFALALSHAVMTWVLVSTVPADALHGLRVGYKYFG
ncbi:MAG TPA: CPBP family glutamic-type intramembrane protease [Pyrinomonadaceae bacterium]|jgi:membrane protease YdiL (CAAX protease family)|nr:CPBP family glutamic-type intramembrane protease [Pyrinomonadaceae bacterium]